MVEEVRKQLEKIGLKKACGSDDLPMEVVKVIASDNMAYPKEYNMTEDMTEKRSVWHMKIKAGPLLYVTEEAYEKGKKTRSLPGISHSRRQW